MILIGLNAPNMETGGKYYFYKYGRYRNRNGKQ